jgi:antitoxin MazE
MRVSKWGNSLAVRLPAAIVEALGLKEGEEIEISIAGKRDFRVARDRSKEKAKERALDAIRRLARPFPPGFKFDRQEANER